MTANTLKALPPDGFCKLEEEIKGEKGDVVLLMDRQTEDVLHSNADLLPECAHDHEATTMPNQVFGAVMCRRIKPEEYEIQFYDTTMLFFF